MNNEARQDYLTTSSRDTHQLNPVRLLLFTRNWTWSKI